MKKFLESTKTPECFICPITGKIMKNPHVLVATGVSYEKSAIVEYLKTNDTIPNGNTKLYSKEIAKNENLKQAIDNWQENQRGKNLFDAITKDANISNIRDLLNDGAQPIYCDPETGEYAIHKAVKLPRQDIVELLLKHDKKLVSQKTDGKKYKGEGQTEVTAINIAATNKDWEMVNTILNYIDKDDKNPEQETQIGCALLWAVEDKQNYDLVEILLQKNVNPMEWRTSKITEYPGEYAIHRASRFGNKEIVKLLLNHNCELAYKKTRYEKEKTAIDIAACENNWAVVKEILTAIRKEENTEDTAQLGKVLLLLLLNYNSIAKPSDSPINPNELVKELLEKGALNKSYKLQENGYYAIHLAVAQGCYEIVKLLLEHNNKLIYQETAVTKSITPICVAIKENKLNIASLLLKKSWENADKNAEKWDSKEHISYLNNLVQFLRNWGEVHNTLKQVSKKETGTKLKQLIIEIAIHCDLLDNENFKDQSVLTYILQLKDYVTMSHQANVINTDSKTTKLLVIEVLNQILKNESIIELYKFLEHFSKYNKENQKHITTTIEKNNWIQQVDIFNAEIFKTPEILDILLPIKNDKNSILYFTITNLYLKSEITAEDVFKTFSVLKKHNLNPNITDSFGRSPQEILLSRRDPASFHILRAVDLITEIDDRSKELKSPIENYLTQLITNLNCEQNENNDLWEYVLNLTKKFAITDFNLADTLIEKKLFAQLSKFLNDKKIEITEKILCRLIEQLITTEDLQSLLDLLTSKNVKDILIKNPSMLLASASTKLLSNTKIRETILDVPKTLQSKLNYQPILNKLKELLQNNKEDTAATELANIAIDLLQDQTYFNFLHQCLDIAIEADNVQIAAKILQLPKYKVEKTVEKLIDYAINCQAIKIYEYLITKSHLTITLKNLETILQTKNQDFVSSALSKELTKHTFLSDLSKIPKIKIENILNMQLPSPLHKKFPKLTIFSILKIIIQDQGIEKFTPIFTACAEDKLSPWKKVRDSLMGVVSNKLLLEYGYISARRYPAQLTQKPVNRKSNVITEHDWNAIESEDSPQKGDISLINAIDALWAVLRTNKAWDFDYNLRTLLVNSFTNNEVNPENKLILSSFANLYVDSEKNLRAQLTKCEKQIREQIISGLYDILFTTTRVDELTQKIESLKENIGKEQQKNTGKSPSAPTKSEEIEISENKSLFFTSPKLKLPQNVEETFNLLNDWAQRLTANQLEQTKFVYS